MITSPYRAVSRRINRSAFVVAVGALLLSIGHGVSWAQDRPGAPASAQASQTDARWAPWLGCWTLLNENVRDGVALDPTDIPLPSARGAAQPSNIRVCVAPVAGASGVTLSTMVAETQALQQTIVADGTERAIDETGCEGRQRAEWSRTGDRLFTHAELACQSAAPRTVSHLAMLIRGGIWLDIQSVTTGGRESLRVRRYQRAPADPDTTPIEPATGVPSAPRSLTLADVREASTKVSPRVLEVALVETGASFDLDGKAVIGLDEAGVPGSVIDLMVALSYPDRFIIERPTSGGGYAGWGGISDWSFGDPYLWGYYAPFAYTFWGYGNPWEQPGYGWVIVDPGRTDGSPQPSGTGRVVDGLGYTRVRPREVEAAPRNGGSSGGADASSGGASTGSSGGSSSGGSSGVSTGGYSGSGSSDSGRTAQPRPPGR